MKLTNILETLQSKDGVISYSPGSSQSGNLDNLISSPTISKPDMMDFNVDQNQQYFSYEETIEIAENVEKFQKYIPVYTSCKVDDSFLGNSAQDFIDAFKNGKSDGMSFDQSYEQYLTDTSKMLFLGLMEQKLSDRPAIIIVPVPSKKSMNINLAEHLQQMIGTKNKNTQVFNHYRKNRVPTFNTLSRGSGMYDAKTRLLTGEIINKREKVYEQVFFRKIRTQQIDLDMAEQIIQARKRKIEKTINILKTTNKFNSINKKAMIAILEEEHNYISSDQFETDMLTASDKKSAVSGQHKDYNQNSGYYNEVKMLRDDFFETMDDFNADMIHQFVKKQNPKKYSKKPLIIIIDDVIITKKSLSQMYKHLVLNENMTTDKYDVVIAAWAKKQKSKAATMNKNEDI